MSDILIFLTATIHCGATPQVKRSDPAQREQDYLEAFRSWISLQCDADVLLCENSAADLSKFREIAASYRGKNGIKLIPFAGNQGAQERGKGYGEIEMLRHAFETLPEMREYRYIIKVSGRYRLLNAVNLIKHIRDASADLVCDIHSNLTYGDTKVVAFTPHVALNHLIPYCDELDEHRGLIIEHLMAKCLHRTLLASGSWAPLPCTPICDGISGSWNKPQRDGIIYRVKQGIKRKIARWIYRY